MFNILLSFITVGCIFALVELIWRNLRWLNSFFGVMNKLLLFFYFHFSYFKHLACIAGPLLYLGQLRMRWYFQWQSPLVWFYVHWKVHFFVKRMIFHYVICIFWAGLTLLQKMGWRRGRSINSSHTDSLYSMRISYDPFFLMSCLVCWILLMT